MPYPVKGFLEINEDMVQSLLMLEILFTQDSEVEYLFCGASSSSEPGLFFSNYHFRLGFKPVHDDFSMTLLECLMRLVVLLIWQSCKLPFFRARNNQLQSHGVGHSPVLQILLQISIKHQ